MSNAVSSMWSGMSRGARIAVIGAATLCVAALIWAVFNAFQVEYRVLFSELAQGDAAAIVAQLKKDKVPYRLSNDGATVSVPAEQVHDVRLTLMTGDLPLSGGVGFEIFDKQGLGATEHSQRVSYQRALQGELARTIGTLDDVKQVRVHLVMPESTLFTRDRQQASAAVALTMRPGKSLERQQIVGVQRLVAAAVPGLDPARVVLTDQRGVTLSSSDAAGVGAGAADARLQVKQDVEEYVTHKIARLLDSAFGPGQAIVSVDVALNFETSKTTIQDLLPAAGSAGEGRIVRRRQVTGASSGEPLWSTAADGGTSPRTGSSSSEIEYEYGRRIDEVIAAPGAIARMSVGVIVPGAVTEEKRTKIVELLKMAAGINEARGDAISVQPLSQPAAEVETASALVDQGADAELTKEVRIPRAIAPDKTTWMFGGLVLLVLVAALIAVFNRARAPRALTAEERQRILDDIQRALAEDGSLTQERARS
jgi:flagellar M-ring protein FliF